MHLSASSFFILGCSGLACCFIICAFTSNAKRLVLLLTLIGWVWFLKIRVRLMLIFVQLLLLWLFSSRNFVWAHRLGFLLVISGLWRRQSWYRSIFERLRLNSWLIIFLTVLLLCWWLPLLLLLFQFWTLIFETGQLLTLHYSLAHLISWQVLSLFAAIITRVFALSGYARQTLLIRRPIHSPLWLFVRATVCAHTRVSIIRRFGQTISQVQQILWYANCA